MEEPKDSGETEEEESSDVEEEEKSRDWADQVEEEVKKEATEKLVVETEQKQAVLSIVKAIREEFKKGRIQDREKRREFVRGLRLWHDIKPRRVRAMCAWVGEEETDLSFKPGAVMTGVRPAAWLNDGWLEGALEGRTGLFHVNDVEYL